LSFERQLEGGREEGEKKKGSTSRDTRNKGGAREWSG
jgi:hypothetical protein